MERIPDESIDLILCDLPYGTTANKWDNVIPFPELWKQYERIAKTKAAIVLTANQMFSYRLIQSNEKLYKYKWIWVKNNATNFMNAKNRPMSQFEEVLVFSKGTIANNATNKMNYFPQDLVRVNKTVKNNPSSFQNNAHDWNYAESYSQEFTNYPKDVLRFDAEPDTWHPTQKPVALWKYLVKTYCKQGGVVLDNCMGSGTTAIACIDTNRHYIGFETNKEYFEKSLKRIENHNTQLELF